jgi:hypothetical protein
MALITQFDGVQLNAALTNGLNQAIQELLSQVVAGYKELDWTRALKCSPLIVLPQVVAHGARRFKRQGGEGYTGSIRAIRVVGEMRRRGRWA